MKRTLANQSGSFKAGTKWLRSWRSKINSRKVFALTDAQYRFWDLCLCSTDADGYLPPADDLAFNLRMQPRDVDAKIAELVELRFIDPIMSGTSLLYRMHDWDVWQRRCDETDPSAAGRMKRHRARKRNAHRNAHRNATVTVTENDSESVSSSESLSNSERDPAKKEGEEVEVSDYAREGR